MKVQQALKAYFLNGKGNESMDYCRQSTLDRTSYWYYGKMVILEIKKSEKRIFASAIFRQGKSTDALSLHVANAGIVVDAFERSNVVD